MIFVFFFLFVCFLVVGSSVGHGLVPLPHYEKFWQIFEVGKMCRSPPPPPPPPTHTHTHTHTHPLLATFSGLAQKFMARAAVARHFGNFAPPPPQANILALPLALPHYDNNLSPPPPPPLFPLTVVFRAGAMLSDTFFPDCGSVVAPLPWCGMVVVLLGVPGEVTVHVVG